MTTTFDDPSKRNRFIFPYKVAGHSHNLRDRMPETSPLREVFGDWERRFVENLMRHWGVKLSLLLVELRKLYPSKSVRRRLKFQTNKQAEHLIANLDDFWAAWGEGYVEELLPYIQEAVEMSAINAAGVLSSQFNISTDPLSIHSDISNWARTHTARLVKTQSRMFRRNLTQTDIRNIQNAVANWVDTGQPFEELVKAIQPIVQNASRARMIAATESTRAFSFGSIEMWKEGGIVNAIRWNTANDELVCPICRSVNGRVVDIARPIFVSDVGDIDPPPAHPRCRCWPSPVIINLTGDILEGLEDLPILPPVTPTVHPNVLTVEAVLRGLTGKEQMYAFDRAGNELFQKAGGASEINFTSVEQKLFRRSTVTHNHPTGTYFSLPDVITSNELELQELRAVIPDGTVHRLLPPEGQDRMVTSPTFQFEISEDYARWNERMWASQISAPEFNWDKELKSFWGDMERKYPNRFRMLTEELAP